MVKKSPAYVKFVGSELENDTNPRFQQIQVLTLAFHRRKWIREGRKIKHRTGNHVATDVESYTDRTGWKNLDAAAIVDGEFCTNVSKCGKAALSSVRKH